jgi:hypothetical protein
MLVRLVRVQLMVATGYGCVGSQCAWGQRLARAVPGLAVPSNSALPLLQLATAFFPFKAIPIVRVFVHFGSACSCPTYKHKIFIFP